MFLRDSWNISHISYGMRYAMIYHAALDVRRARDVLEVRVWIYGVKWRAFNNSGAAPSLLRSCVQQMPSCWSQSRMLFPKLSPTIGRRRQAVSLFGRRPNHLFFLFSFFSLFLQIPPTSGGEHLPEDSQAAVGNQIKRKPWVSVSVATPHWRMCCVAADICVIGVYTKTNVLFWFQRGFCLRRSKTRKYKTKP